MDVLRQELNAFYASQNLDAESLDYTILEQYRMKIAVTADIAHDCRVITDAASDRCYISGRSFPALIGLTQEELYKKEMGSSDEDDIYERIHPEDLVEKRMLEYDFFTFIDGIAPERKLAYKATCHLRMKDREGAYIYVDNSTRVIGLSPKGKVWLILCCYEFSSLQDPCQGILPHIIDFKTGQRMAVSLSIGRVIIFNQ